MQGVILAAGRGARMGPLSDYFPKALLPVGNAPLILLHLETLRQLRVTEVFIVIGHLGDQIRAVVDAGRPPGMTVHYVEQQERQGLAHAVGMLEHRINGPFVLLLGDIYFEFIRLLSILNRLDGRVDARGEGAILATKKESDPARVRQNFSVELDRAGRVCRVVEKPTEGTVLLKGCGLYLFMPVIFDAIHRTPRSALRNEYELTDAIQVLIDNGAPVYDAGVVDWDVNITTPEDLVACNRHALRKERLEYLVGRGCNVAPGTTLDETVLGDDVRIVRPCRLEACVVLPGTVIDTTETLRGQVLYPGGVST